MRPFVHMTYEWYNVLQQHDVGNHVLWKSKISRWNDRRPMWPILRQWKQVSWLHYVALPCSDCLLYRSVVAIYCGLTDCRRLRCRQNNNVAKTMSAFWIRRMHRGAYECKSSSPKRFSNECMHSAMSIWNAQATAKASRCGSSMIWGSGLTMGAMYARSLKHFSVSHTSTSPSTMFMRSNPSWDRNWTPATLLLVTYGGSGDRFGGGECITTFMADKCMEEEVWQEGYHNMANHRTKLQRWYRIRYEVLQWQTRGHAINWIDEIKINGGPCVALQTDAQCPCTLLL